MKNGSERKAEHHRYYRAEKTTVVWPRQKDAIGVNSQINCGLDSAGEKEKRTSKENVDGRGTSSHDNRKFRIRAMEKRRGMAFGLRKLATVVKKTGQIDRRRSVNCMYNATPTLYQASNAWLKASKIFL